MSRAVTRSDNVANIRPERKPGDDLAVAPTLATGLIHRDGKRLAKPKQIRIFSVT